MIHNKPDILGVIGQRVELRRRGKEFVGLCPFHLETTPSFTVNDDKGVFYCHGCHEGGDVVTFVKKFDGLTFPEALTRLGIGGERPARPALTPGRQRAAVIGAAWVNEQRAKFNTMIANAMECRHLADEIGDFGLAEIFDRELICLRGFYDSLGYPRGAVEMLAMREAIEGIAEGSEVSL